MEIDELGWPPSLFPEGKSVLPGLFWKEFCLYSPSPGSGVNRAPTFYQWLRKLWLLIYIKKERRRIETNKTKAALHGAVLRSPGSFEISPSLSSEAFLPHCNHTLALLVSLVQSCSESSLKHVHVKLHISKEKSYSHLSQGIIPFWQRSRAWTKTSHLSLGVSAPDSGETHKGMCHQVLPLPLEYASRVTREKTAEALAHYS